ncbi:MAG: hypothetical protein KDD37_10500 [Bdellovibrionales bacterium]|nr:hypothetical protein [Bdellovibrionales bacterium]
MKKLSLIFCCLFIFAACEEDDDILDYSNARNCLDEITPATSDDAKACVASLADDDSERANKLKCAAEFLFQGLDTSTLAQIFSDIQEGTGSEMNSFMSALYFKGDDRDDALANADLAYEACNASGSTGMAMFGSFSYSSTLMARLDAGWDGQSTPDLSAGAIGGGPSMNNSSDEELGEAILNIQSLYCSGGSSNEDICGQIDDILDGSSDPTTIGAQFRDYLN